FSCSDFLRKGESYNPPHLFWAISYRKHCIEIYLFLKIAAAPPAIDSKRYKTIEGSGTAALVPRAVAQIPI
ncbi:hypothetical protein QA601_09640, partial [Chitinispirillales bacterium ANBcel5]|nr:hypothetical protein [Chitinispirillales bacterium ANBcel5]